jgi:hypothetical protein
MLALLLGFAGQIWIVYSYFRLESREETFNTCIFRRVTGIPCPSCGTVHSIISIAHGRFSQALEENPMGYAGLLMVAVIPWWVLADLLLSRDSFYRFYLGTEKVLKRKTVIIPLLLIIMLLWAFRLWIH